MQINGSPACRISTKPVGAFTEYVEDSIYGRRQPRIYYGSMRLKIIFICWCFMNALHIKFTDSLWDGSCMALCKLGLLCINMVQIRWGRQHWSELSQTLLATRFTFVSCLAYSPTMKMEATCSFEKSVDFQRTTWRYIPEDINLPVSISTKSVESL
jgi:hypothetical protein